MSSNSPDTSQPISSGEFEFTDPERYDDVDRKHRRLAELLVAKRFDAWLLQTPPNFSWLTSGSPCPQSNPGQSTAALFLTADARVVAANNIDASFLFDRKLGGLGFQLKQRAWHEPREVLLADLCRGRKVAVDCHSAAALVSGTYLADSVLSLRRALGPIERERMRKLGQEVAHSVEATARNVELGQTEAEINAQLAHRLLRREVDPVRLRACVDGRTATYRQWTGGASEMKRCAMISATGSRDGLHCTATRTVLFGLPTGGFVEAFHKSTMLCATGMHFTQSGMMFRDIWPKVKRIYEKQNLVDEWRLADQAEVTGYRPCETLLTPDCELIIEPHLAICWHPSVAGAMVGDTILVTDEGFELVTPASDWPIITITVKGEAISLPDLLVRPSGG